MTAMVAAIVKDFGGLNILVNNAGLANRQRFVETTAGRLAAPDRRLALRRDPLLPCRRAASRSRQERPHRQRHRRLLARRRIRTRDRRRRARRRHRSDEVAGARNSAVPAPPPTRSRSGWSKPPHDKDWVDANREKLIKLYPVRRLGLPGDIAPMVALLASPHSGWITGQVLSISGGFSMV